MCRITPDCQGYVSPCRVCFGNLQCIGLRPARRGTFGWGQNSCAQPLLALPGLGSRVPLCRRYRKPSPRVGVDDDDGDDDDDDDDSAFL